LEDPAVDEVFKRQSFFQILVASFSIFFGCKDINAFVVAAGVLRSSDFTAPSVVRTAQYPPTLCFARLFATIMREGSTKPGFFKALERSLLT
jgi:hypothetical protein